MFTLFGREETTTERLQRQAGELYGDASKVVGSSFTQASRAISKNYSAAHRAASQIPAQYRTYSPGVLNQTALDRAAQLKSNRDYARQHNMLPAVTAATRANDSALASTSYAGLAAGLLGTALAIRTRPLNLLAKIAMAGGAALAGDAAYRSHKQSAMFRSIAEEEQKRAIAEDRKKVALANATQGGGAIMNFFADSSKENLRMHTANRIAQAENGNQAEYSRAQSIKRTANDSAIVSGLGFAGGLFMRSRAGLIVSGVSALAGGASIFALNQGEARRQNTMRFATAAGLQSPKRSSLSGERGVKRAQASKAKPRLKPSAPNGKKDLVAYRDRSGSDKGEIKMVTKGRKKQYEKRGQ